MNKKWGFCRLQNCKSPRRLPLTQDFPIHLLVFRIIPLHHQEHGIAHHEVGICVLVGVAAHTYRPATYCLQDSAAPPLKGVTSHSWPTAPCGPVRIGTNRHLISLPAPTPALPDITGPLCGFPAPAAVFSPTPRSASDSLMPAFAPPSGEA